MIDDFATHIPAWRIRRLRGILRAAEEEGRRGEADEGGDHRAIRRRRALGRAAMPPTAAAGASPATLRRVLRHGRLLTGDKRRVDLLRANAIRHFTTARPPRGALATAYADLKAEMKAAGLPTPRRHRWRAWLAYAGFVPLPGISPDVATTSAAGSSRARRGR